MTKKIFIRIIALLTMIILCIYASYIELKTGVNMGIFYTLSMVSAIFIGKDIYRLWKKKDSVKEESKKQVKKEILDVVLGILDIMIIAIYSGYVENKTGYSMIVFYVICVVFLFFIGKNICYIRRILREK